MKQKNFTGNNSDPADTKADEAGVEPASAEGEIVPLSSEELEYRLISSLEDQVIQERIKAMLQKTVREELSKMSVVLREAVRNWVFKEKQKYNLTPVNQAPDNPQQREQVEQNQKRLEEENLKLKRALELKEHENKIIMSALKKLTPKDN